ncbi:helix-turn-helix domain-containing protein [Parafilimonas sp.]|uniref:helix-turn-helix domain-containing protein n=1 Tax=Parafilimonas sp. TaxID=1969739 RepID=UPI0039E21E96
MTAVTITQITPPELETLIENSLRKILSAKPESANLPEQDRWLNLTEFCQYHPDKPAKATVYGWVNAKLIPAHKSGKKLRFLKSEIDAWLMSGKKKTFAESAADVDTYLKKKKGQI